MTSSTSSANSLTLSPAARALSPAAAAKFTVHPFLRTGLTIATATVASQGILLTAATFLIGKRIISHLKKPADADLNPTLDSAVKVDAFMLRQYWASVVIPKSLYQGIFAGALWCSWCTFTAGAPLYFLAAHSLIAAGSFALSWGGSFRPLLKAKEGLIAMQEMIRAVTPPNQDVHPRLLSIAKEALESAVRGDFDSSKFCNLRAFNDKHRLISNPDDLAELFNCYDNDLYKFESNISWMRDDRLKSLLFPFVLIGVKEPIVISILSERHPHFFSLEHLYAYLNEEQLAEYQSYALGRIDTTCVLREYEVTNHQRWEKVRKSALENTEKDWKWICFFLKHIATPQERTSPKIIILGELYKEARRLFKLIRCPYYPAPGAQVPDQWFHHYFMGATIKKSSQRFQEITKDKNSWDECSPEERQELIQIEMAWSLAKYRIMRALDPTLNIYPLESTNGCNQTTLRNLLSELTETIEKPFLAKVPERRSPDQWADIVELLSGIEQEYFCLNSEGTGVLTTNGLIPGLDLEILEMTLLRLQGKENRYDATKYDAIRKDAQQKLRVLRISHPKISTQFPELLHQNEAPGQQVDG